MHEPTGSLLNVYLDRMDGKVPDKLVHEGTLNVDGLQAVLKKVYGTNDTTDDTSGH